MKEVVAGNFTPATAWRTAGSPRRRFSWERFPACPG